MLVITLRTCARDEVIGFVVMSTKFAKSRDVDILASGQWCQDIINGEKAMGLGLQVLDKGHE